MTDPIKAKIQELCPDVMELKFGCRVVFQHTPTDFIPSIFIAENRGDKCTLLIGDNITPERMNKTAIKEILGSPITLAVALRAIAQLDENIVRTMVPKEGWGFRVHRDGTADIEVIGIKQTSKAGWFIWNLEHDNYDQQSEECKQFIGSLIMN